MTTIDHTTVAEFVAAWDQPRVRQYRPRMRVVSALFKATNAGQRPVAASRLAALTGLPVADTLALARSVFGAPGQLTERDGMVHLELATPEDARFWVTIGGRRIPVGGCAPDLFWTAYFIDTPLHVEATCPATGTPIRVELTATGVDRVTPAGTVVAMVDPSAQPEMAELLDHPRDGEDICGHMPFFASTDAAADWLARHPGGRLFGVAEFFPLWRAVHEHVSGDILGTSAIDVPISERVTPVPGPARDVHRAILRAFATTGTAPRRATLGDEHLALLVDSDIIGLDTEGEIAYAYPFSTRPTPHRVRLAGGAHPYAMCAVDALGMPTMLDTDAVITSRDPRTGEPITVTVIAGAADWRPATAVVLAAAQTDCCATTSAEFCCGTINFFATSESALAWAAEHPEVRGHVLDQDEALREGVRNFGTLLR